MSEAQPHMIGEPGQCENIVTSSVARNGHRVHAVYDRTLKSWRAFYRTRRTNRAATRIFTQLCATVAI